MTALTTEDLLDSLFRVASTPGVMTDPTTGSTYYQPSILDPIVNAVRQTMEKDPEFLAVLRERLIERAGEIAERVAHRMPEQVIVEERSHWGNSPPTFHIMPDLKDALQIAVAEAIKNNIGDIASGFTPEQLEHFEITVRLTPKKDD